MKKIIYLFLLFTAMGCTKKVQHFAKWQGTNYNIDPNSGVEDATVSTIISPYRNELSQKMNLVIGDLAEDMEKAKPTSTLTNFIADAVFDQYNYTAKDKIDLFISNYGGIRSNSFAKGEIIVSDIFELMPFENTIVIVEVDEKVIKKFCDKIAKSGGWPISKNSGFGIKDSSATSIIINNVDLAPRLYKIGLPDYVANGGDGSEMFKNLPRVETPILIRDLMIDYVKRVNKIIPDRTPRIKIVLP